MRYNFLVRHLDKIILFIIMHCKTCGNPCYELECMDCKSCEDCGCSCYKEIEADDSQEE